MTVDVEIEERLNGLMNLLSAAGININSSSEGANNGQEQRRAVKGNISESTPSTQSSSSDAQILEIIKKLRQAPPDSPEILAALKSPEFRAFAMITSQQDSGARRGAAPAPPRKPAPASLDDVIDDDDAFPKIGPGYSDEVSVMSELSTPTVMTKQPIAEEELYKDVNGSPGGLPPLNIALGPGPAPPSRPPMQIGAAASGGAPAKTRNLVSQVRPGTSRRAIARTGGAAAQRRLNYQQAMAKLHPKDAAAAAAAASSGKADKNHLANFSPKKGAAFYQSSSPSPTQDPSEFPSLADNKKGRGVRKVATDGKKKSKHKSLASQEAADQFDDRSSEHKKSSRKKSSRKESSSSKQSQAASGWPAFDDAANTSTSSINRKKSSSKDPFAVDGDGFFSSDAFGTNAFSSSKSTGSDPFAPSTGSDPFSEAPSKSRRSKEDPFADASGGSGSKSRSRSQRSGDGNVWASEKSGGNRKERSRKGGKSSRRASLSM